MMRTRTTTLWLYFRVPALLYKKWTPHVSEQASKIGDGRSHNIKLIINKTEVHTCFFYIASLPRPDLSSGTNN